MEIIPYQPKKLKDYLDFDYKDILEDDFWKDRPEPVQDFIEDVYYTLLGQMVEGYAVEGVENAFAPGTLCEQLYAQVYHTNCRLSARLKSKEEDRDVFTIISNMAQIEKILCYKMFLLGAKFGFPTDGMPHAPSNIAEPTAEEPCNITFPSDP